MVPIKNYVLIDDVDCPQRLVFSPVDRHVYIVNTLHPDQKDPWTTSQSGWADRHTCIILYLLWFFLVFLSRIGSLPFSLLVPDEAWRFKKSSRNNELWECMRIFNIIDREAVSQDVLSEETKIEEKGEYVCINYACSRLCWYWYSPHRWSDPPWRCTPGQQDYNPSPHRATRENLHINTREYGLRV